MAASRVRISILRDAGGLLFLFSLTFLFPLQADRPGTKTRRRGISAKCLDVPGQVITLRRHRPRKRAIQ